MRKKSIFKNKSIRLLTDKELIYLKNLKSILRLTIDMSIISYLPNSFCEDNISRPLILKREIVIKIKRKHGEINPVNLLINAND